ncbi:MAG: toxin-antitoxin system YwqK family antitoxin [Prevotellaceae bacterium]|jgi:antitoxin component YwqK of YwqJK toxin-antitoxin module|nr:toxin-antitoxin system YwqK family antitoxin [Prevotellaceae bacterium]
MKNKLKLCLASLLLVALGAYAQQQESTPIYQSGSMYYRDKKQTTPYTGDYREYYPNGTLKLEIQIGNGLPEGAYVVYFEDRKPKEVRSYKKGKLHGLWRTYDASGVLISEAEYSNGEKNGTWRIWDKAGKQRYEMSYLNGKRTGTWRMWDEKGKLTEERKY